MKLQIIYVTDLYCVWCYGVNPVLRRIQEVYTDRLAIQTLNGGMIQMDVPLSALFGRYPDPVAMHRHITDMTGETFGESYLANIRKLQSSPLILNSDYPARALKAFEALHAGDPLHVHALIQHAYYREGMDLRKEQTYAQVAKELDIDFGQFLTLFRSAEIEAAVRAEYAQVSGLGVSGYPAVLAVREGQRPLTIAQGYKPFDELSQAVDRLLGETRDAEAVPTGMVCGLNPGGC